MRHVNRQAGLSELEFSIVLAVLALIWLVALNHLRDLQELGEKTTVEMVVSNILSGLRWEMADRIMTQREPSIAEMAGSNPVRWLEKMPEGYLGEFSSKPDRFQPGNWYFDTAHKELRYRPRLERNLQCRQCERMGEEIILSWRIEKSGNPMFGRGDRVRVAAVATYQWF